MHSFVNKSRVDARRFHVSQSARLRFLVRKFREDAASGDHIMLRFTRDPVTEAEIRDLHRALRRYGPVVLLHVTKASTADQVGTVAWLERDLMVGFIDRFGQDGSAAWEISFDCWLTICRKAFAMCVEAGQTAAATPG
jgi:hypothetical protein